MQTLGHFFEPLYDLILGTPFLFQHQVMVGLNDTRMIVGSATPQLIRGSQVQVLESRSVDLHT